MASAPVLDLINVRLANRNLLIRASYLPSRFDGKPMCMCAPVAEPATA